jgi:hypothetical protein
MLHYHHLPWCSLSVKPCTGNLNDVIARRITPLARCPPTCHTKLQQRRKILHQRCKYVRFTVGTGIISSSYDVFANAQRIVKVKEAKSEERTVMKS